MSASARRVLTAADLETVCDNEIREVPVPEWGEGAVVYLRALPAGEGIELSEAMSALPKDRQFDAMYLLLAATLSTEGGVRLFDDNEKARAVLCRRSPNVLLRLQKEALKLQGWQQQDATKNASGGAALVASPIA